MKPIKIDNSGEIGRFLSHLQERDNKRLLVTAPFGAGKSYFLNDFFAAHPQYLPVTLYPGDYSVSSNEDIFELIKYDIIDALLACYPDRLNLTGNDFSNLLLAQQFLSSEADFLPLLKSLAQTQSIGFEKLLEIFEHSKALYRKFTSFKERITDIETRKLKAFMQPVEQKRGSIRENDGITRFIAELLSRIKVSAEHNSARSHEGMKQTILVVDDLDRLEADQIFRLFNIFSAHHDSREDANKFGFDKVILVCDLDNLEHMFRHRYGPKASFDGYIDKFYSYEPYIFNQQAFLKQKAREYLLYFEEDNVARQDSLLSDDRFGKKSMFFETVSGLAEEMVERSLLRARNFQKFKAYQFQDWRIELDDRQYSSRYFPLLVMARTLGQFFPRTADLIAAIDELATNFPSNYEAKSKSGHKLFQSQMVSYALPFLVENFTDLSHLRSSEEHQFARVLNEHGNRFYIVFSAKDSFSRDYVELVYEKVVLDATLNNKRNMEPQMSYPNFYHFFSVALKRCVQLGYL